jgi:hypothetical protein
MNKPCRNLRFNRCLFICQCYDTEDMIELKQEIYEELDKLYDDLQNILPKISHLQLLTEVKK